MLRDKHLTVTVSPHIKTDLTTEKMMWTVITVLLPVAAAGVYFFGIHAGLVILVSIISAVLAESLCLKIMRRGTAVTDGSAFLTGLLLSLCLPPEIPLWMAALGSFFAIAVGKQAFGGLGYNIFNPALAGRAFLMLSFAKEMTTWKTLTRFPDSITAATPLNLLKEQGTDALMTVYGSMPHLYKKLFLGNVGGSIGETSAVLLLIGGCFLIARGIITWHIPVSYLATVAVISVFTGGISNVLFQLLAGGLMLGAFFMATDLVTTPITKSGQIIFGIGCGLITMLIRVRGGYPEGVCYSILLLNAVTPLIERFTKTRIFGTQKQ
ncbi:MAG: RnfABCDGE type electron transport complex subunit D [Candidatus Aureabacteria bacterium]|nr:RnfABCDGE type electron transport complex subunit D [Candidatus Auribacterota bacterium]MCK5161189.1 RnfABCDGE type electron transport complex subunit D [Candidatus Auribacterota bacterium]